jgi:two-component system cell cycle response regulator DivK
VKKVLIVEDNENNMELITFILESYGYQTMRAETGLAGVEMACSAEPDFIILDIQLPDILGTEVLRRIRQAEQGTHVPIIAMTSYAMAGDRDSLLAAGCDGYIEKPIDPLLVMGQIKKVLGEGE